MKNIKFVSVLVVTLFFSNCKTTSKASYENNFKEA